MHQDSLMRGRMGRREVIEEETDPAIMNTLNAILRAAGEPVSQELHLNQQQSQSLPLAVSSACLRRQKVNLNGPLSWMPLD